MSTTVIRRNRANRQVTSRSARRFYVAVGWIVGFDGERGRYLWEPRPRVSYSRGAR